MYRAELYHNNNGLAVQDAINTLKEYADKIKWKQNGARIVDAGSGDGTVTASLKNYLPSNFKKIVGCDISQNMIDLATRCNNDNRVSFRLVDFIAELPEDLKGSFDHLLSFNMLHWSQDQEKTLKNFYELLDEGGSVLITLISYSALYDMYRILARRPKWASFLREKQYQRYISPYMHVPEPDKVIRKRLEGVGFKNIEARVQPYSFTFYDWESLKNAMMAVVGIPIPEDRYADFVEDLVEVAKDLVVLDVRRNNYESGKIVINHEKLVIYATK